MAERKWAQVLEPTVEYFWNRRIDACWEFFEAPLTWERESEEMGPQKSNRGYELSWGFRERIVLYIGPRMEEEREIIQLFIYIFYFSDFILFGNKVLQ